MITVEICVSEQVRVCLSCHSLWYSPDDLLASRWCGTVAHWPFDSTVCVLNSEIKTKAFLNNFIRLSKKRFQTVVFYFLIYIIFIALRKYGDCRKYQIRDFTSKISIIRSRELKRLFSKFLSVCSAGGETTNSIITTCLANIGQYYGYTREVFDKFESILAK